MAKGCAKYIQDIADAAERAPSPEFAQHLETCAECRAEVARTQRMLRSLQFPWQAAPADIVARLPQLRMPAKQTWFARLLGPAPATAFRDTGDDHRLIVEAGNVQLRLVYLQAEGGVRVMARLPSDDWRMESGEAVVDFLAADFGSTGFAVVSADARIEVPSLVELHRDVADRTD